MDSMILKKITIIGEIMDWLIRHDPVGKKRNSALGCAGFASKKVLL